MSYILEALRKAEREDELKQQTEWEEIPTTLGKPTRSRYYWKILVNLLIVLNLLVWTWLFWPKPPVSSPVVEFME